MEALRIVRRRIEWAIVRLRVNEGVFGPCFPFTAQLELSRQAGRGGAWTRLDFFLGSDRHGEHPRRNSAATTTAAVLHEAHDSFLQSRSFRESCTALEKAAQALLPSWRCSASSDLTFERREFDGTDHGGHKHPGREE